MKIAFVTDSTAYLTKDQIESYQIHVVPLSVIFGDEVFREGVDLTNEEFYVKLAGSKQLPTTSQPPVGEFVKLYEKLLVDHDVVMCLMLSSNLSGTFASAQTAATMVDGHVIVVDSKITSYGLAGPLIHGVELARRGATPEQILEVWDQELAWQRAYFVVDTLEFLHKGGRIGGAAAVFGALLQIKPILTVTDGRVDLYEKVRTHKRAMEHVLAKFDEDASLGLPLQVGIVHANRRADAEALQSELAAKYPKLQFEIAELGPVIGTHSGPGLLAILYFKQAEVNL